MRCRRSSVQRSTVKSQRLVDPRQGAVRIRLFGFELGEPALEKRRKQLVSLLVFLPGVFGLDPCIQTGVR